ncbi:MULTISPECIES: hypothetical protein [unclassified Brevundimonas]|uniref:hypothetical protein n=1 Tax=unclassified Brevundimonas TaxID=2622653 RepID=UPI003F8DE776
MSASSFFKSASAGLAVVVAAGLLGGCNPPASKGRQAEPPASGRAVETPRNVQLLAAAEDYETLTESAFDKPVAELEVLQRAGYQKAQGLRRLLDAAQGAQINALNGRLDAARTAQDRAAIAIAAVETFRILVSAQDASGKTPVDVSLLDYAGFKFDALNKARPVNWDEMAADARFARETWARLSPQVKAPGLSGAFESAVSGMELAAARKNDVAASVAASNELALVDALEEYFTALQ